MVVLVCLQFYLHWTNCVDNDVYSVDCTVALLHPCFTMDAVHQDIFVHCSNWTMDLHTVTSVQMVSLPYISASGILNLYPTVNTYRELFMYQTNQRHCTLHWNNFVWLNAIHTVEYCSPILMIWFNTTSLNLHGLI